MGLIVNKLQLGHLILPGWPASPRVLAVSTTRRGGVGEPPYDSLNLADNVGDDPARVAENRRRLAIFYAANRAFKDLVFNVWVGNYLLPVIRISY